MAPTTGRRRLWLAGAGLVALAAVALLVLHSGPPKTDAEARPQLAARRPSPADLNVVVVTLDTLRADRLGCYGFRGIATPEHRRRRRRGRALRAGHVARVPLTLPSHTSIFTGLIPPTHGVRDNGGFFVEEKTTTLAERMKEGGYTTGAFVGAWVLDSRWGLDQGFDLYSDRFDLSKYKVVNLGTVQKKGDEVMDLALDVARRA